MKNYVLLVDVDKCTQCYNCVLACKDEHFENDFPPISVGCKELDQNWLDLEIVERGNNDQVFVTCRPVGCRHCADPLCVTDSGAAYKREDGIVILDPSKADSLSKIGACPYSAIVWNDEKNIAQKCTMCAHLLDAGDKEPRCVEACPTSCLTFGDLNDPSCNASRLVAENSELMSQTGIVRYFNRTGRIIAGCVYQNEKEVAEGAEVYLINNGDVVDKTFANGFGDFRFINLDDAADYSLEIKYPGNLNVVHRDCRPDKDFWYEEIYL